MLSLISGVVSSLLALAAPTPSSAFASFSLSTGARMTPRLRAVPKLIAFDLDNTLWCPELYQLRKLQRANAFPVAGKDVQLFDGAKEILDYIKQEKNGLFADTTFAVASRTKSVEWAHDLLRQFGLDTVFDHVEIFPGDKKKHFSNLASATGHKLSEMLFFDDARDGRFGNCEPVSSMGVLCVHCPNGLSEKSIFADALDHYVRWSEHCTPGTIIEWDNTVTTVKPVDPNERFKGNVKFINWQKRYGFIAYGGQGTKDMFFHFNSLNGIGVKEGDEVSFSIARERGGKDAATNIEMATATDNLGTVEMRVFSMNLPFAALLSNGYKTLETRNGTMFVPYEAGTKMLLHVGQRIYPDGDRHIDVMKSGDLADDEIAALKSLPKSFGKGMAVAIVELGKTYDTTLAERCDPDFQRRVGAFGQDSGMRATEIRRVAYLKRGVKVSGRGGVFKAKIPRDVVPDGWLTDSSTTESGEQDRGAKKVIYSATF